MKKISLLCYVLMASLCLGLSSCSKDDYEDDQLIGVWQVTNMEGYWYEDGEEKDIAFDNNNDNLYYTFSANGTGDVSGDESYTFKWSLNGKKKRLTLQYQDDDAETFSLNISGKVMTMEVKGRDEDGEYYIKMTLALTPDL